MQELGAGSAGAGASNRTASRHGSGATDLASGGACADSSPKELRGQARVRTYQISG